jgi:glycosyltransferase involved in cell wall biosynthesis
MDIPVHPLISVIIPARNAGLSLSRCLESLARSSFSDFEVIVVDDGSTDSTIRIAEKFGSLCVKNDSPSGPAAARNLGATLAQGKILLFVDADVTVHEDALAVVADAFFKQPDLAAMFGSYDDRPLWKNTVSQYKNLTHHYIHQISSSDAWTFWTGLGAIRNSVFVSMGGFDSKRYRRPSIEDVEMGYRLREAGHRIMLDKRLLGKHLKKWGLRSLLYTDIACRAIPWTKLMLETRSVPQDLNFRRGHRTSAMLVGLLVLTTLLLFSCPLWSTTARVPSMLGVGWLPLAGVAIFLNRHLYQFFLQRKGFLFTAAAIVLHFAYYFYSGVVFVLCMCIYRLWFVIAVGVSKRLEQTVE